MNFIALTRSPKCEVVLVNLDYVRKIFPEGNGAYVVGEDCKRSAYGINVVESVQEISRMIDDLKRGLL